jgi:hypothetical protein
LTTAQSAAGAAARASTAQLRSIAATSIRASARSIAALTPA